MVRSSESEKPMLLRSPTALRRTVLIAGPVLIALVASLLLWRGSHAQAEPETLPTALSQWQAYEGSWASSNGEITDRTGGRGDKLMTGDPNRNDFIYRADLRFNSERDFEFGDAGLVLRASNLTVGTDSLYGYYVGIRPGTRTLKLGRMQNEYIDLALRTLDAPIQTGTWYRMEVHVRACAFAIQVSDASGAIIGRLHFDDRDCVTRAGQVGLRSYGMVASWRNLSVQALP